MAISSNDCRSARVESCRTSWAIVGGHSCSCYCSVGVAIAAAPATDSSTCRWLRVLRRSYQMPFASFLFAIIILIWKIIYLSVAKSSTWPLTCNWYWRYWILLKGWKRKSDRKYPIIYLESKRIYYAGCLCRPTADLEVLWLQQRYYNLVSMVISFNYLVEGNSPLLYLFRSYFWSFY